MRLLKVLPGLGGMPALRVFQCAPCNTAETVEVKKAMHKWGSREN